MLVNTYAFDSAVMMQHGYQDMLASMVFLLFLVVGEVQLCTSSKG